MPFISLSCLIFLARTSNIILNRSEESGHPCLVPDHRGKAFSLSPLSIMFAVGFHIWLLLCSCSPSIPILSTLKNFIYFIYVYFWLCWVFVAVHGLSLVAVNGGYSSLRHVGFSLWWLLLLWSTSSRHTGFSSCGAWALERRLSSCGTRT